MVQVNPINVLNIVLAAFSALPQQKTPINDVERELASTIENILYDAVGGFLIDAHNIESLEFERDMTIPEAYIVGDSDWENEDETTSAVCPTTEEPTCSFEDEPIDFEYKKAAVDYWKSGKRKRLNMETVKHRYKKVASKKQLKRWEKQVIAGGSHMDKLRQISECTLQKFIEANDRCAIIHDIDIRRWALQMSHEVDLPTFKASYHWLINFKSKHGIVSRKITKFTSKTRSRQNLDYETVSESFVNKVREELQTRGEGKVYNSDQSGFNLEIHSGRTLTIQGRKHVEAEVQSISSTTHSYTIQPIISASGQLLSPLFIVLHEPTGKLGPRVQEHMFRPENVYISVSRSGKLSRELLQTWLREVFFPAVGSNAALLLDSWSGQCTQAVREVTPKHINFALLTIPPGTTAQLQPLDVYGFRMWKNFVKHFSDMVILFKYDVNLHTRDNILRLQSLTHNQFSSPRFNDLFKYAWYKSGYVETKPLAFMTPVEFCFHHTFGECAICGAPAVITCAWCKKSLCFQHFFTEYHYCSTYTQ